MADSYGYVRLSRNADGRFVSCDLQDADVRADAGRNGDRLVHVYRDDGLSAWNEETIRPGFEALVARMQAGDPAARRLYAPHIDRYVRQIYDLGRIIRHRLPGTVIHSDGRRFDLDDAHDIYRLTQDAAHAALSSGDTSRRTRRGLLERAERGGPHGGIRPFGLSRGVLRDERGVPVVDARGNEVKTFVPVADEAAVVRAVFGWFVQGRDITWIAGELRRRTTLVALGLASGWPKTVRGGAWTRHGVGELLRSRAVAGVRPHRRLVVPQDGGAPFEVTDLYAANWPALVDRAVWDQVQGMLAGAVRAGSSSAPERAFYLLSGLVVCGRCGSRMVTHPPVGHRVRSYTCRADGLGGCGRVSVSSARLDEFLGEALAVVVADKEWRAPGVAVDVRREEAKADLEWASAKLAEIARLWSRDRMTDGERDEARAEPAAREKRARAVLAEAPPPDLGLITGGLPWGDLELFQRRAVARARLRSVRVAPASRRGRVFDTSRIEPDWR